MSLSIMYSIIMMLIIFMIMYNSPTPIIICILMYTSLIAISLSFNTMSPWMPFVLLLILIGGMMILFIYMTSLIPNKHFLTKNKNTFLIIMVIIPLFFTLNFIFPMINFKKETNSLLNNSMDLNINLTLNNIFSTMISPITVFMGFYLLLTMIIIIKITTPWEGPLQQKN